LDFYFQGDKSIWDQRVYVYICNSWDGEPIETEEMKPKWFDIAKIPYDQMWEDDKYWLPEVINGKYLEGIFTFNDDNHMIKHKINIK
jgi:hypothetical protein